MWQYKENIIFALIKVLFKWPFLVFWSRITGVAAFYARCVRRWIERPKREEFGRLWQVIFALWCHLFPLINLPTINVELTYPPPPTYLQEEYIGLFLFTSLQEAVKSGKAFGDRLYLPRVTQQKLASHHPPSLEQRKNETTLKKLLSQKFTICFIFQWFKRPEQFIARQHHQIWNRDYLIVQLKCLKRNDVKANA